MCVCVCVCEQFRLLPLPSDCILLCGWRLHRVCVTWCIVRTIPARVDDDRRIAVWISIQ